MRDAIEMWRSTRMVVLTALCAALYAALLIPFKAIVLIPGLTEVRPASALPVVLGLLFGPAAAWGSAFGNLIGDFFGTLTPGSFFGFIGNFFFAYVPYRLWATFSRREATGGLSQLPLFILVCLMASSTCAVIIAWGVDLLGMAPYHVLGTIITLNNALPAIVLGGALLPLLYARSRRWGLLVSQNMSDADAAPGRLAPLGAVLTIAGSLAGVALAVFIFRLGANGQPPAWLLVLGSVRNAAGVCALLTVVGAALLARPPRWRVGQDASRVGRDILDRPVDGPAPHDGLAVSHLTFRYPSWATPALRDVSLDLAPGQWLTVVGPTGAGKSTLCLALCGIIPQLQDGDLGGRVSACGMDTADTPVHDIALRVGTLFQHFESQLFCTDVRSEVAFALEQRGVPRPEMLQRVDEALAAMDLTHLQHADPATLSGGQKQRLALAALLAAQPDVLVLDEPTTDLDPQGRRELVDMLRRLCAEGKTLVVVENDLWSPTDTDEGSLAAETMAVLGEGALQARAGGGATARSRALPEAGPQAPASARPVRPPGQLRAPADGRGGRGGRPAGGLAPGRIARGTW